MNSLYQQLSSFSPTEQRKLSSIYRITGLPESQNNEILFSIHYYNNSFSEEIQQLIDEKIQPIFEKYCKSKDLDTVDGRCQNSAIKLNIFNENISDRCAITHSNHYFKGFIIDRVGWAVVDFNVELKNMLPCPKYEQDFTSLLSNELIEGNICAPKGKSCFNCGSILHNLNACDKPKDMEKINANRTHFLNISQSNQNQMTMYSASRYHEDTDEPDTKFIPGVISRQLQEALGITDFDLPPYIYKMRELGYPPGYLNRVKKDSLAFYGDKDNKVADADIGAISEGSPEPIILEKSDNLILYPGFNAPLPIGVKDRSRELGFKSINPREFLTTNKRHKSPIESDSKIDSRKTKKLKSNHKTLPEAEDEIKLNSASVWNNSRGWWFDGLSVNVFPPKRLWRCPPALLESPSFPRITNMDLIPINMGSNVYGDEEIPTNRLDKIIKYLRSSCDKVKPKKVR